MSKTTRSFGSIHVPCDTGCVLVRSIELPAIAMVMRPFDCPVASSWAAAGVPSRIVMSRAVMP